MRITPNFVAQAITTSVRPGVLSLRDSSIPLLENLESLPDIYGTIDLTDNELITLGPLPTLLKLRILLVAKNKISNIQLAQEPHLHTLSLVDNSIGDYATLEKLRVLVRLENLAINGNPVMLMEHTREFIVWCLPQLKVLNFSRVTQSDRQRALELFGTLDSPTELVNRFRALGRSSKRGDSDDVDSVLKKLSSEEKERLKLELKQATSLKEIDRIETALRNGYW